MRTRKNPVERRREFIDISMELFCSKGYEQTMVQDICRKAGVAKGTFFYYFATKEDVLKAIFEQWSNQFSGEFSRRAETLGAVPKLRLFLQMSARENAIEPLVDKLWEEQHNEMVRQLWQRVVMQSFNPLLCEILAKGNEEGAMHVVHVEESLQFFWSIVDVMWPYELKESATEENMTIRSGIASRLMEELLGIKAGSLAHFEEAD